MADSDPSSSSVNDTVTVNVGTLSDEIATAIQQSRTACRRLGSGLLNSGSDCIGQGITLTVTVSLIEVDYWSESAITEHCTPLSRDDDCAYSRAPDPNTRAREKSVC